MLSNLCKNQDIERIRILINFTKNKKLINDKNKYEKTPLDICAINGNLEITKLLLEYNADPNISNYNNLFPIHRACEYGNLGVVKLLIKYGAEYKKVHKTIVSPFSIACKNGKIDIVKYLLEETDLDIKKEKDAFFTPIQNACKYGHLNIIKYLVKKGLYSINNYPLLHISSEESKTHIAKWIIEKKIEDVNVSGIDGSTALQAACAYENMPLIKFLIERKADVNAYNKDGFSALHMACHNRGTKIVKYLIDNKANINQVNRAGQTPLHIAIVNGNIPLIEFLIERGGLLEHFPREISCIQLRNTAPSWCPSFVQFSLIHIINTIIKKKITLFPKEINEIIVEYSTIKFWAEVTMLQLV